MNLISRIILIIAHILLFAICADELMTYVSKNYPTWAISVMTLLLSLLVVTMIYHVKNFINYLKNKTQS